MKHLERRGFSLVELLVVLGIIAALLGILLPVFSTAREHARRVKCLSNIEQLNAAWLMYAGEFKGHFCSSETQNSVTPGHGDYLIAGLTPQPRGFWSWIGTNLGHHEIAQGMLWPYLRDLQVYSCPDNPVLPDTTYAINGLLAGRIPGPSGRTFLTLSELKHSDQVFVFIEAMSHPADGDGDFDEDDVGVGTGVLIGAFCSPVYPSRLSQSPGLYHALAGNNGCTISFADGHAVFWEYAAPSVQQFGALPAVMTRATPDLLQLQAWSGGPIPPSVTR